MAGKHAHQPASIDAWSLLLNTHHRSQLLANSGLTSAHLGAPPISIAPHTLSRIVKMICTHANNAHATSYECWWTLATQHQHWRHYGVCNQPVPIIQCPQQATATTSSVHWHPQTHHGASATIQRPSHLNAHRAWRAHAPHQESSENDSTFDMHAWHASLIHSLTQDSFREFSHWGGVYTTPFSFITYILFGLRGSVVILIIQTLTSIWKFIVTYIVVLLFVSIYTLTMTWHYHYPGGLIVHRV